MKVVLRVQKAKGSKLRLHPKPTHTHVSSQVNECHVLLSQL